MRNKICTCFGHREIYTDVSRDLSELLENLILSHGVTEFWTGGRGSFDESFSLAVRVLKRRYPDIKLILIVPYFSSDLNTHKQLYESLYDDVVIPDILANVHPKAAITKRNQWMIEKCDYVITFVYRDFGGAHIAKKYAKQLGKTVFEINTVTP